jgi:hypothetical protein
MNTEVRTSSRFTASFVHDLLRGCRPTATAQEFLASFCNAAGKLRAVSLRDPTAKNPDKGFLLVRGQLVSGIDDVGESRHS